MLVQNVLVNHAHIRYCICNQLDGKEWKLHSVEHKNVSSNNLASMTTK